MDVTLGVICVVYNETVETVAISQTLFYSKFICFLKKFKVLKITFASPYELIFEH